MAADPGRVVEIRDLREIKSADNTCSREDPKLVSAMAELRLALETSS